MLQGICSAGTSTQRLLPAAAACRANLVHFLDTLLRLEVELQCVIPRQASSDSVDNVVLPVSIFKPDLADTAATLLSAHGIPT